jgi:uncharacterized RDD family membrane protein YckC
MTDAYYILEDGEQKGPFTFDELIEMDLDIHTRVLSPLDDTWQDACDLPEFFPYFEAQGIHFPTEDNLATFWWRMLAYIIDSVLMILVFEFIISICASNGKTFNLQSTTDMIILEAIYYAMSIIYNTLCEASAWEGSLGKKFCKLVVVDADGMGLTYVNALSRNLSKILSNFFFGIGFLSVLWNDHRQAWHDQIAKTYVVKL